MINQKQKWEQKRNQNNDALTMLHCVEVTTESKVQAEARAAKDALTAVGNGSKSQKVI